MSDLEYSVVLPVYNEQDNVIPLYRELTPVMKRLGKPYQIIFVDDGSTVRTIHGGEMLSKICFTD